MATNTVFIIHNTAGVPVAAIQPNTLNGPDGVQQSSDLSMFGLGYATWGQASDENDYRILESFACQDMSAFPSSPRYAALSLAGTLHSTPASAVELGDANGINVPIVGQIWFNTTLQQLYVYTSSNVFEPTAGTVVYTGPQPTAPTLGTLWYNSTSSQLEIWNGGSFVSVASQYLPLAGGTMTAALSMGGNQIHNLLNPTSAQDAATKQYVDTVVGGSGAGIFVPLAGNVSQPMSGTLYANAGMILNGSGITLNSANIVVNTGTLTLNTPPSGVAVNANGRITNVTTSALTDAVTANYGDGRWLNMSIGGTVSGLTTFSNPVTVPLTPTVSTQAASKGYVDSALINGFSESFYETATYSTWAYSVTTWAGTGSIGYCKYPNGMIEVWGVTPAATGITEGGTTVTLPAAIGSMKIVSAVSSVLVNIANYNVQDQAGQVYFQPNVPTTTITIILQYMAGGSAAGGVYVSWFVKGY